MLGEGVINREGWMKLVRRGGVAGCGTMAFRNPGHILLGQGKNHILSGANKTGRHIVQKQQTDNPKGMDEQLTSLKVLYNDLGAQVRH